MLKPHPMFIVVAMVTIACLTSLWLFLQPAEPKLVRYKGLTEKQGDYRPGGSGCGPSRLAKLPVPTQEAARERDRCSEVGEDYRLKANDLVQQTRSADAAEAVVALTYGQSWIALMGIVLGFVTMVSAIAAALYASQAASETKRGADAAVRAAETAAEANRLNRGAFVADQRPWLSVTPVSAGPMSWKEGGATLQVTLCLKNSGRTPALHAIVWSQVYSILGGIDASSELSNLSKLAKDRADSFKENNPIKGEGALGLSIFPGESIEMLDFHDVPASFFDEAKAYPE